MPTFTYRRRYRAFPRRPSRARAMARGAAFFLGGAIACSVIVARAFAGAGSGTATISGPNPVTAGAADVWSIQYRGTESFAAGGVVEVDIPVGWSAPQRTDSLAAGYVKVFGQPTIDSVRVSGQTVRIHISPPFGSNSFVRVNYGIGGVSAHAHAQTTAQDSVLFQVRSDPLAAGTPAAIGASPFLNVIAAAVVSVDLVDGSGATVDTLTRTTDQDTTQLFLRGYDAYGNPGRLIACDWTLSGGVGAAVPAQGTGTALTLDVPGTGVARADSAGVWADSTGAITVLHGAYAGLEMTAAPGPVAAGTPSAVSARAHDADGNTVTDGAGSLASVRFVAYADSVGFITADPRWVDPNASLSTGSYAGSLIAREAGTFWLAARDSAAGFESARHRVDVIPAGPDHLALQPDTLRLTAGVPDTVTVTVHDLYGNRTPVPADETLTLWTDRATGTFRDLAGTATLFEVTLPAGTDSTRFTFTDTQATTSAGRIRVIDADNASPFLSSAEAPLFTGLGPLDHYTLSGPSGPLQAGAGFTLVLAAFDSFGNALTAESGETLTPTVTSGAASVPPSVTLTNGAASIPVTPTQAAPLTIQVGDGVRPTVTYGPVTVNPSSGASFTLAPDSLELTPGQGGLVTVTVKDAQGNPVSGHAVTFFLGAAVAGTLESVGETTGGPGSQGGITSASGTRTVRYRAPLTAPALDSVYVSGGAPAPAGIRAITRPGATASLRVLPVTRAWIAGVPESVLVTALDAFGNVAIGDGAAVTMSPSGSVAWNPASGPLVAGQFVTMGSDTVAETIAIGADRTGGGSGNGGSADVAPAAPAGLIPIAATRDSLTADGHSASTLTFGPVRDAYGNPVRAGTLIGVASQSGTLVASDASALFPGLDLVTGANSLATAVLVAAASSGPDTVTAASRAGSAAGAHGFLYLPPPTLTYVAGSLAPGAVSSGNTVSFTLQLRNTGAGTIQLGTGSTLSFGAGASAFSATLGSATSIGSGAAATLTVASAAVSAALPPGSYAPAFRAVGTDGTGAGFDFFPSLAGAQVSVLGVGVAGVSASPDPVPLGGSVALVFDVSNVSGTPGDFTGATVTFSAGTFSTGVPSPPLGTTIPAGATTRFTFLAQAPSSGIAPGTVVNATLQATLSYGGNPVAGMNAVPLTFGVVSAAQITALPGTGAPARLLRGRTVNPSVSVGNSGAAAVTLARGTTRLVLDLGGTTLATALRANTAVNASDQATLAFDSLAVPAGIPKGRYRARLVLDGTESGQAFADTVSFAPDSLDIVDPAVLSVAASTLTPDTVSAGQARPLALTLQNSGDVPFTLDPSTTLELGAPVSVSRTLAASPTIGPGSSLVLTFSGGTLGSSASPGDAPVTLDVFGTEEGVLRAQSLPVGTLHAMPRAALQYVARSTAPAQTRPGQAIDVILQVRNAGGSPFLLDPAASRFTLSDGTDVMTGFGSGPVVMLPPAGQVDLTFPNLTVPGAMASQPYRVDLLLSGSEWGLPASPAIASPDSEIVVLDPLAGLQARAVDTGTPVQAAPGGPAARVWGLELTPLAAMGSGIADSLRSLAITVLTDGSATASPYGAVASMALRDRAGTLLAQTSPAAGAPNPVTLSLATPLALGNAPESLFVEVAFRAGTAARSVALRLARPADVVVLDVFTGGLVPIVGGGGLPFAALTSPEITFFDRPHGYPNPFHAGSEAILLSYVLGQDAAVKISVYTLFGDLVREMSMSSVAGLNEVPWDGRNGKGELVRPGVYVAKLDGPGLNEKIKVGVLR